MNTEFDCKLVRHYMRSVLPDGWDWGYTREMGDDLLVVYIPGKYCAMIKVVVPCLEEVANIVNKWS